LIGRTGSGKTSLLQALMRMVYVREGDIRIGNHSIFEMDVRELRKLFGVVPQSPYLFAGTIRSNLDRVGTISTEVLEKSMKSVGLYFPLDHTVTESGGNFSVGERQLICLARVIAAGRSIILMDEPTSGLDPETDARISEILRTALKDKTVLTIAHRQESLGSYDRIIEMQNGRVEESPKS
jgi:ABC-type multidrug transport system fused ATPase/permease subunit